MSSDDQENPPKKLSLSRDKNADADTEKSAPPPAMKLRRKSETEEPPAPKVTAPVEPAPEEAAKAPSAPSAPSSPSETDEDSSLLNPDDPFSGSIKEGEIKEATPPPLSKKKIKVKQVEVPPPTNDSGSQVEAAVESINQAEETESSDQGKSSFLPSILVILLLLGVLGAAGYGLWMVLQPALTGETGEFSDNNAGTESKGPIGKAKDVISKVNSNVADADGEIESFSGKSPDSKTLKEAPKAAVPPQKATTSGVGQSSVTEYLSSVHVGGMRQGERPMIIIDGTAYKPNDVVNEATGLKFDGFRDGKLAFRDRKGIVYLKSF